MSDKSVETAGKVRLEGVPTAFSSLHCVAQNCRHLLDNSAVPNIYCQRN